MAVTLIINNLKYFNGSSRHVTIYVRIFIYVLSFVNKYLYSMSLAEYTWLRWI